MRGMYEATPIQDTYCSGLGAIEDLGSNLRFWIYVLQTPADDGGPQERVVVQKLVTAKAAVPDNLLQMLTALGTSIVELVPPVTNLLQ